jgi:cell division protein FtsB
MSASTMTRRERPSQTEEARRTRRVTGRALALLVVVGALLVAAMYPLRAYLAERSRISDLQGQVTQLERQNAEYDRQIAQLHDPAYLERLARECLGMIKPGEIGFVVVPKHGKAGARVC